jgi:hypothetical protein
MPTLFPLLFRYFWFIAAGFMLVNIVVWRRRLAVVVTNGAATTDEVNRFVRGLVLWLVGMPVLIGTIAVGAGWDSPFCAGMFSFGNAAQSLISVIGLTGGLVLMWWIWRGNGADVLARIGPALGNRPVYDRPYSPRTVRLVVTALLLISNVGAAVNYRIIGSIDDASGMACHAGLPPLSR